MPKKLHRELNEQAKKKGLTGPKRDRYVYGTLDKILKQKREKRRPK